MAHDTQPSAMDLRSAEGVMDLHPLEQAIMRSRRLRPGTKNVYLQHVRAFLAFGRPEDPRAPFSYVTAALLWRAQLIEKRLTSTNVAINALKFASANYGGPDFAKDMQRVSPATIRRRKRRLTDDEIGRLLETCTSGHPRDLRDRAIFLVSLATSKGRAAIVEMTIKDGLALLGPDLGDNGALQNWLFWLADQGVYDGPLFRSLSRERVDGRIHVGEQLTADGLYRIVRERAKLANIRGVRPKVLTDTGRRLADE
jgi:integrase